jgi:MFS-type transporter involved in bile tolerance (Atg22 family)
LTAIKVRPAGIGILGRRCGAERAASMVHPFAASTVVVGDGRPLDLLSRLPAKQGARVVRLPPPADAWGDPAVGTIRRPAMWTVAPGADMVLRALVLLAVSNTGFELACVFYNTMLPEVAPAGRLGRVSGLGWGLGYFGSLVSMGLAYVVLVAPEPLFFGLDAGAREPLRLTAPLAALWFLVLMLPLVLFGPPDRPSGLGARAVVADGLRELRRTLRAPPATPSILWYLLAHMLYIDGINTLVVFGPLFAAGSFGFTSAGVVGYGITFYFAAGAGSFALGWLDDRFGSKPLVMLSLVVITVAVVLMVPSWRGRSSGSSRWSLRSSSDRSRPPRAA